MRKNPGVIGSAAVANVAYKQSWCEILITNSQWRSKEGESRRMKGRLVGNDVPVEILKDRIPTVTCKSLRKKRLRLSHIFHKPGGDSPTL